MAFTPENFTTAERALMQVVVDVTAAFTNLDRAIEQLTAAEASLISATTGWGPAIQYINDQAAANPVDDEWQTLKRRKDKIAADIQAMKATAKSVKDSAIQARG